MVRLDIQDTPKMGRINIFSQALERYKELSKAPCLNLCPPKTSKNFGCTPSNGIWNNPSDCWRIEKLLPPCIKPWALLTFGLALSELSTHLCLGYPALCLALFFFYFTALLYCLFRRYWMMNCTIKCYIKTALKAFLMNLCY